MNSIRKIRKDENGDMFVSIMLTMLIGTVLLLFFIEVYGCIINYQNVNYAAKHITKIIECEGAVTDSPREYLKNYNASTGMDMTYKITNVDYFNKADKTIQFRDPFTIEVYYTSKVKVLSPMFSREPIYLELPMKVSIQGMSEVYYT